MLTKAQKESSSHVSKYFEMEILCFALTYRKYFIIKAKYFIFLSFFKKYYYLKKIL